MSPRQNPFAALYRNKYGNKKTEVDGFRFDSKHEAKRYLQLKSLAQLGVIQNLERQVVFTFPINGEPLKHTPSNRVVKYILDFRYTEGGAVKHEDAKGMRTPEYKLKAALMRAVHGIHVIEV